MVRAPENPFRSIDGSLKRSLFRRPDLGPASGTPFRLPFLALFKMSWLILLVIVEHH